MMCGEEWGFANSTQDPPEMRTPCDKTGQLFLTQMLITGN